MAKIVLKHWDYEKKESVVDGEMTVYDVAKNIDGEGIAELLDTYCNNFSVSFNSGVDIGHKLRGITRAVQRSVIVFLTGMIAGLSEQERTDPRNELAIALAKKVRILYDDHGAGMMV